MNRINRYLLKSFFHIFILALTTFIGLYLLIDFFEKVDDLLEYKAGLDLSLSYFALKIPLIFSQVCPMAVLMAVFMTIGGLARTSELTALHAGGVSLARIAAPLIATAWMISLLLLLVNENLVHSSVRTMNHIWDAQIKGEQSLSFKSDRLWLREGNRIINIQTADPDREQLNGVSLFRFNEDFRLLERFSADQATFNEGGWQVEGGLLYRFNPESGEMSETVRLDQQFLPLDKSPQDFRIVERKAEEMNFKQLRSHARKLRAEGYDSTRLRVDMHNRLASPFAALIMAFIGIPFALQRRRGSSIALGVAITIAIGFGYHVLQAICLALGYAELLPAIVAAWVTNLIFLLFGLWLLMRETSA
ncbi:LPS export ABC transporter permease LptG [Geoalkalibacter subterraneus]|uniref:Permease n=1 Tax=Geoalkalibacter subterraneus TaxID=483547 RepID=A0A0B5FTM1_9BACT|nr:LPS export ABC transporter permease LptG [Geoalkalibacter subterraneus]AJF06981.1 hypothetical protein GSUB_10990 [Geoalkalibacter subterraneus]